MAIDEDVIRTLRTDSRVTDVQLVGSRKDGGHGPLSDWDFRVEAEDIEGVSRSLPSLLAPLKPIYQFWNPLPDPQGPLDYLVLLPGPVVLDLHFPQVEHQPRPPWLVNTDTLQRIDTHFWDWIMYVANKGTKGHVALADAELRKMHWFLLAPMRVEAVASTVEEAVTQYLAARNARETEFGLVVSRDVQREVAKALQRVGVDVAS